MSRTPAEQAIYDAERPIYDAAARLDKAISVHRSLTALLARRLPVPAAEAEMAEVEDHLAIVGMKLAAALAIHETAIERLQLEEEVRYARAHGLLALASKGEPANDNYVLGEAG